MLSFSEVRLVTEVVLFPGQDIGTGVVPTCVSSLHSRWVHNVVHRVGVEDSLWFKENLVNLGVEAVARQGGRWVSWVDADITFTNLSWAADTVEALQTYCFVQPWTFADLLGPDGYAVTRTVKSFASQFAAGKAYAAHRNDDREYWHPGFAWAARVDSLRSAGGLLEATLGSADNHFACALIGAAGGTVPPTISGAYKSAVLAHEAALKGMSLGAVQGTIRHSP